MVLLFNWDVVDEYTKYENIIDSKKKLKERGKLNTEIIYDS